LGFVLCRQCAADHPKGLNSGNYLCGHDDSSRGWISTITHIELNKALDSGYRVNYLVRTLEWDSWSSNIFKPFIK
jgi:hypothetical protein